MKIKNQLRGALNNCTASSTEGEIFNTVFSLVMLNSSLILLGTQQTKVSPPALRDLVSTLTSTFNPVLFMKRASSIDTTNDLQSWSIRSSISSSSGTA